MRCYPVSTRINLAANDDEDVRLRGYRQSATFPPAEHRIRQQTKAATTR